MSSSSKINLLVIPDLFPSYDGDVKGIFVIDYIKSVLPYCNVIVFTAQLRGLKKGLSIEEKEGYTIYRFCITNKKSSPFLKPFQYFLLFIKSFLIASKLKQSNIIHAHGTIVSGTLSYFISIKLNIPFIITEHQGPFSMTSEVFWKKTWTNFIMQKANCVCTVSHHLKNEILSSGITPKKLEVTYNPVDTELFSHTSSLKNNNFIFVGRLDNFKGALRCLNAFMKIHEQIPNWTFTIVGNGEDYEPIVKTIEQNQDIKHRVKLTGQLQKSEIAEYLSKADFLVFPSQHESFGLVIAEALSTGIPVIVGDKTAPKEFVNTPNGLIVPYNDIDSIAESILLMTKQVQQYSSVAIRQEIINKFSFDSFGKKMLDLYKSIGINAKL